MLLFPLSPYYGKKICVALSGGVDSVCLLHFFHRHAEEYRISLSALTCEHGIRGEQSLSDLAFVKNLCDRYQIPLTIFQEDIPALSKLHGRGLEEEGREFRYLCFSNVYQQANALVATAHHKDDYAETVLFRLIRGTSPTGLNVFPQREGIVRPLLDVSRAQILQYAQQNGLTYVTDESNFDQTYTRNYLRNTVLPSLEQAFQGAGAHLVQFARLSQEDDCYLRELALSHLQFEHGEGKIPLSLPSPLFRRACVEALKRLGINKDYTQANINDLLDLTALQSGKKINLPDGVECAKEGDFLVFYRPYPPFEGEIALHEGEIQVGEYLVRLSTEGEGLQVDFDKIPPTAVVRCRREGDYITPYAGKRKTLKKFLTDKKIPARVSKALPLIAIGSEILVVCGVEIADGAKITDQTKNKRMITLFKQEN